MRTNGSDAAFTNTKVIDTDSNFIGQYESDRFNSKIKIKDQQKADQSAGSRDEN